MHNISSCAYWSKVFLEKSSRHALNHPSTIHPKEFPVFCHILNILFDAPDMLCHKLLTLSSLYDSHGEVVVSGYKGCIRREVFRAPNIQQCMKSVWRELLNGWVVHWWMEICIHEIYWNFFNNFSEASSLGILVIWS